MSGVGFGLLAILVHDSPLGVMVVDSSLRVVFVNPSGLAILEQNDGLSLVGGALKERDAQLLEPRLQRAMRGDADLSGELSVPFYVPRPSERRPYEVTLRATSFADAGSGGSSMRHVAVYIRDPDQGVPIDEHALRERYRLTPAEARTAVALTVGSLTDAASDAQRLRPMTIRGYVKQIFAKTGTHSQLEILRLVLSGARSVKLKPDEPRS